ncbi:hypothetical protein VTK73DRAFT_7082 [Phialemonium thermophilum]|uniref:Amino-acid acetyltransferase, mitochondrial n=1 Tax=Phialemonium thermophilum TaxID=223376 RepID=A0ABR3XTN5_9PEZI
MILRSSSGGLRKATSATQLFADRCARRPDGPILTAPPGTYGTHSSMPASRRTYTPPARAERQKRDKDRDFIISVLESSATKRDAKAYLQTFGDPKDPFKPIPTNALRDSIIATRETPRFVQGAEREEVQVPDPVPHVAIVELRKPELWSEDILDGVAKTLTQLRTLGLLSIIVVDSDLEDRAALNRQINRAVKAIGNHGMPGAKFIDSALSISDSPAVASVSPPAFSRLIVDSQSALLPSLRSGYLVIVPTLALTSRQKEIRVDSNDVVLTLARFLSGLQISRTFTNDDLGDGARVQFARSAVVDRIIVIDPEGGIPTKSRPNGAHVFINMEDEYETAKSELEDPALPGTARETHLENLKLAKDCLSILPSAASAIITSPAEAANLVHGNDSGGTEAGVAGFVGSVGTRRKQNPLIHNLLTDRPVYSSSLPLGRIKPKSPGTETMKPKLSTTTLAKRGLPVTIFPDPLRGPWLPPEPGAPRLRLTDTCVDLPRLVHLIEDSFNRKLDVQHYLDRVNDSLAGIIIAGEYEGGAILTWERPFELDEDAAYHGGRMVPYLDKFAVLKRSQGAGGVADIVFNAMVRDCFPDGVCWRSRKDNPVNRWYFERSRGTWKLRDSNWAMFWTTPEVALDVRKMRDYENVCRNITPSWADKQKAAD